MLDLISKGRTKQKTIRLIDNNKAAETSIRERDEENSQHSPDRSADLFEAGGLKTVDAPDPAHIVEDVDHRIEQANDMMAGAGDFAEDGPQPNQFANVTELDRNACPKP